MTIFSAKFSTGQVVEAAGVAHETLQNWMKRDLVIGHKQIEGGGSQGRHRQFSFFNVMEIAVAKALIDVGMTDLQAAFRAADAFAHAGQGPLPGTPERAPGCPFKDAPGITLIVANKDWSDEIFLSPTDSAMKLYADIFSRRIGNAGAVILNASDVFDRVTSRLGYHPDEVMGAAYTKTAYKGPNI